MKKYARSFVFNFPSQLGDLMEREKRRCRGKNNKLKKKKRATTRFFVNFVVYCPRFIASLDKEYDRSHCCCEHLIAFQTKIQMSLELGKG